jgi:hypothetical protein
VIAQEPQGACRHSGLLFWSLASSTISQAESFILTGHFGVFVLFCLNRDISIDFLSLLIHILPAEVFPAHFTDHFRFHTIEGAARRS